MAQPAKRPEERRPEERPPLKVVPKERVREEDVRQRTVEAGVPPASGLAIGGAMLSFIGLFLPVIFALVAGVAGAIMGYVALGQIRQKERSGSWIAWSAMIVGGFVTILAIIGLFAFGTLGT